jgi:polar amino acid transport system substrate-binding protein
MLAAAALVTGVAATARSQLTPPMSELAPTGSLRVGIGVGAASSAFWTTRDASTGEPRGVTVDLASELAGRLNIPLRLVAYANSGEVSVAANRNEWDVTFLPVDAERAAIVDFGPAYYVFEGTYLVRPGSPIQSLAEVDREDVRVAGIDNTTTARAAQRSLRRAKFTTYRSVEPIVDLLRTGQADAVAMSRESLRSLLPELPGARILDGAFHTAGVAVAVPKNRPNALAYVTAFIEDAKRSGVVRRAFDRAGLTGAEVAPPLGNSGTRSRP